MTVARVPMAVSGRMLESSFVCWNRHPVQSSGSTALTRIGVIKRFIRGFSCKSNAAMRPEAEPLDLG